MAYLKHAARIPWTQTQVFHEPIPPRITAAARAEARYVAPCETGACSWRCRYREDCRGVAS
jgi:hypothetical protein